MIIYPNFKSLAPFAASFAFTGLMIYLFLVPQYPICGTHSPVALAKSDMRSVAVSIESYRVDNGAYPAAEAMSRFGAIPDSKRGDWLPTTLQPGKLSISWGIDEPIRVRGVTTPVAYMTSLPKDVFSRDANGEHLPFAYYNDGKGGWILISPGPDGDYDINAPLAYDSTKENPSGLLVQATYDPSNGTGSNGDIYRFKD